MALILTRSAPYELIRELRDGGHEIAVSESAWHFYCSARYSTVFDLLVFGETADEEITPLRVAQETRNSLILLSPAPQVGLLFAELRVSGASRQTAVVPTQPDRNVKFKDFTRAARSFGIPI